MAAGFIMFILGLKTGGGGGGGGIEQGVFYLNFSLFSSMSIYTQQVTSSEISIFRKIYNTAL